MMFEVMSPCQSLTPVVETLSCARNEKQKCSASLMCDNAGIWAERVSYAAPEYVGRMGKKAAKRMSGAV